jgi:vitamin-K-epoxide reductase (warfarin-sensitive)
MQRAGHEVSAPSIYRTVRRAGSLQSRMMRYLITLLALAGVMVSVMALRVHYSTETQPCSINEKWDCGIVNHSPFAEVAHVPVAAIGIVGYLLLAGLSLARRGWPLAVAAILGLAFSLYLTHIEKDVLQVWCVYCVSSLGIISAITLLSLLWATFATLRRRRSRV